MTRIFFCYITQNSIYGQHFYNLRHGALAGITYLINWYPYKVITIAVRRVQCTNSRLQYALQNTMQCTRFKLIKSLIRGIKSMDKVTEAYLCALISCLGKGTAGVEVS